MSCRLQRASHENSKLTGYVQDILSGGKAVFDKIA